MSDDLTLVPRREFDHRLWDGFVLNEPECWLWHISALQDALSTWPGRSDCSFAVFGKGEDVPLAIVPLQHISDRIKFVRTDRLDSLGGAAIRGGIGKKRRKQIWQFIVEHFKELSRRRTAFSIEVSLSALTPAYCGDNAPLVNPLLSIGFENTLSQTWMVDLRPDLKGLWQGLAGRTRTAVRKAEKEGITVRLADRDGDLDRYYRLHCETYRRTGMPPHPKSYFEIIWSRFFQKNRAVVFMAEHGGSPVAADNFGTFKNNAIYWTGCANAEGLRTGANCLIQWHAIQWMKSRGFNWYEVGEAFPSATAGKMKGLNDFKKSFGGSLRPFYKGRLVFDPRKATIVEILKRVRSLLK